jgi:hypothetical protein
MSRNYEVITNERTHLVRETGSGRWLGGVGASYYRTWVFPFYTPSGLTVIQEFPHDHPFHNGFFVGQHPVVQGERIGNLWVAPPLRMPDDPVYVDLGRVDAPPAPQVEMTADGARFTFESTWRDPNDAPLLDEQRVVRFSAADDATICEMSSRKIAAYGPVEYPQTKYGSIGIRVEPRLLPTLGGTVIADNGRQGRADVAHGQESDFVAYENEVSGHGICGVLITVPQQPGENRVRGPWFIRDYGMALLNPTWHTSISTPQDADWTVAMRLIAFDGALTEERVARWLTSEPGA